MLDVAVVGFGSIGRELAGWLAREPRVRIAQIVVRPGRLQEASSIARTIAPTGRLLTELDLSAANRPGLVVECAGHRAVTAHVMPALEAGVPCLVASIGALHEAGQFEQIEAAAARGGTTVRIVAGAVGGIDALSAARVGGLDRVLYTGRKPPQGWRGTAAEAACALAELRAPCVVFRGSARDAARTFPKNANVAATIALASLGLDRTEVELVADPGVTRNVHRIEASGAFGRLSVELENLPLATNAKTSALTVYSLVRAVQQAASSVAF